MKTCPKCKIEKPIVEFSKDSSQKDGLQSRCKLCNKQYGKAYREANAERKAEYNKAWREANKERVTEYKKAWNKTNAERKAEYDKGWYEANREREAERIKAWQKANPDKCRAYSQARRALELEALVDNDITVTGLRELYDDLCFYYLDPLYFDVPFAVHVDHLIPLSKGGEHSWNNVCLACATCNLTKNAKNPLEHLDVTLEELADIAELFPELLTE